jgi:hypothetical protein
MILTDWVCYLPPASSSSILEKALETGSIAGVVDLIQHNSNPLASVWDTTQSRPLQNAPTPKPLMARIAPPRKTPREAIEEEQAKRRFLESSQLSDVVCNKIMPKLGSTQTVSESAWTSALPGTEGAKRVLSIDCGSALCMNDGVYVPNVAVRLVVADFLTDRILLDKIIALAPGFEAVDLFPALTGLDELPDDAEQKSDVLQALLSLMSSETVLISNNPNRVAQSLELRHSDWLSLSDLLKVDPIKKNKGEGLFYVRNSLTVPQFLEAYLGEAAYERMKILQPNEKMIENCLGMNRLVKAAARTNATEIPILISPPRRVNTIYLSHIPSNWSEEEIKMVLPTAIEVDQIDFTLDTAANEWRGETHVTFKKGTEVASAFERLTACTDVFVGWEWLACGKVTDDSLRALGSDFGPVVGVRIQDKYVTAPKVIPGKEESRPFGFISMARFQDASDMGQVPKQIVKDGVSYHVKVSKKPISAFKRVPLGEGDDYIEAFIM